MRVTYCTGVGGYRFDVHISIYKGELIFEAIPQVTPEVSGWRLHLSKSKAVSKVLNEYSNWMVDVVAKTTELVSKKRCTPIPFYEESVRAESCLKCAFWGVYGDTNPDERVCVGIGTFLNANVLRNALSTVQEDLYRMTRTLLK